MLIEELTNEWQKAGICEGDTVLIHSSLKRTLIKFIKQGQKVSPDAILNSFIQAVGSSGTLLLPLFNFDFTKGIGFDYRNTSFHMRVITEVGRVHPQTIKTGKMKTVIIVQARMTSTRLPGKILKKVLGKSLLEYQIERLGQVKLADEVVIATTINETDEPIVQLCNNLSTPYFRGSQEDVLSRYYETAKAHQADLIVRVTSDCPLIDPQVIDRVIKFYIDHQTEYDYVSNSLERTYPRGMDTEVFSFNALQEAFLGATALPDREHVTPFIHRQPQRYSLASVNYSDNQSHHRWTVDTPEDFELIKRILEAIYPNLPDFTLKDCLNLLQKNPEWLTINAHVQQKKYGE